MAEKAEEKAGGQTEKKSVVARLVFPIFALLNLVVLGGGSFLVWKSTLGFNPPSLSEAEAFMDLKEERVKADAADAIHFTLPPFTVNLAGQPRRLIRVEMTLEMLDKDGFEEIVRNSPAARDAIVRILNRKTFKSLETIQGKLFLKDQIAVTLNQNLRAGVVKDVFFSEFLIQ